MMKGQFFIISSVIIVFTIVSLISLANDFGIINLTKVGEMGKLKHIDNIKKVLNKTVYASYANYDCTKLRTDLDSTRDLLEREFRNKGINLEIDYRVLQCVSPNPPNIWFNFTITTEEMYSLTEFGVDLS